MYGFSDKVVVVQHVLKCVTCEPVFAIALDGVQKLCADCYILERTIPIIHGCISRTIE